MPCSTYEMFSCQAGCGSESVIYRPLVVGVFLDSSAWCNPVPACGFLVYCTWGVVGCDNLLQKQLTVIHCCLWQHGCMAFWVCRLLLGMEPCDLRNNSCCASVGGDAHLLCSSWWWWHTLRLLLLWRLSPSHFHHPDGSRLWSGLVFFEATLQTS